MGEDCIRKLLSQQGLHVYKAGGREPGQRFIPRVGQNRIYTPYMTVYLVISLPKLSYIHRIHMVLANPIYTTHTLVGCCASPPHGWKVESTIWIIINKLYVVCSASCPQY